MFEIRKTVRAERDLEDIWYYSFTQWGETRADAYLDELAAGTNRLAHHPELGKPCDDIRKGYRFLSINRHLVYYKVDADVIRVMRVLHDRMTPTFYL